jgi:RNA polymerase sigma-70 factor (ECF subfamily)
MLRAINASHTETKVRLFRARATIRRRLFEQVGTSSSEAFQFLGARCDRIVRSVMDRVTNKPRI